MPVEPSHSTELPILPSQNPPIKPSRRWLVWAIAVGIFCLLVLYFARNILLGTPVDTHTVIRGDLRQSVVASGRVIWPQRVAIAAEVTGRIAEIPVIEGQKVSRGQLLIQLEDRDELANLAQAQTALEQAEAKLRQQREVGLPSAQQTYIRAQADVDQLSKQLVRLRQLKEQNFVSQVELDSAIRNLNIATSQLDSAKLQVTTNQPAGSEAQLAMAAFAQAQASVQLAQVKLEQDSIFAPADGVLISRSAEPGDIVQPGKELMVLAAAGETQIEVQIDEKNLAKLAVGQTALGSADAFADQQFPAEVAYINPGVDATRGSVQVKLRVNNPPAYLRQDMTVSVDIETARRSQVLIIPTGTVRDARGDSPWVLVVRNHQTERQAVILGVRGDDNVEVTSGLAEGDAIIISPLIKIGQHVRAQETK
jgi:HlyD family secretion protein